MWFNFDVTMTDLLFLTFQRTDIKILVMVKWKWSLKNEPAHEIMVLFVLRKIILQMRMRSQPVGLDI